ncbi:pentatricopeptide repeat-containing protein At3g18970 isoform X2 [Malania oleifera]|nr:pentatricopeptide repeat-containing protein At3g18970 isoform X2 [Malania oleifera]XP_057960398.1 pentatricopeptide repeat-containing protein At3g18970 isoform X2 [Malania oleifera]XP_057960399.1 pentatricopeptide repeat-containing protein At3g18970 isoform X2 [Malania oleifera]XP_057960401.1 pentatricopeptide repeat-containing protein At3g18970 isoform X2 [Malania oleifera]XP_057960402.1 pentatricopeptide repeat-containing protein At3g18970 isoform X2 [Malania oleifera]XP_057960403.1 penta
MQMASFPKPRCLSLLQCNTKSICYVKQLHAQFITHGLKSPSIFAKLIEHYCAVSSPDGMYHAHRIFNHFGPPNVFLLNTLIRCVHPRDSIFIFANWVSTGDLVFDDHTYIFVLGACARSSMVSTLWVGKQMHAQISKCGSLANILVQTTIVHFYASNKDVGSARRVFDEMNLRSSITWNAMITGYCSQKEPRSNYARDALMLFCSMLVDVSGPKPTDTTMACILSAASQLGVLETGICVHGYVEKTIYEPENDVYIGTSLLDMYSKCGSLDHALSLFKRMKEKNVLTWTAMMTGLAIHGEGKEALEFLDSMEAYGIKPNSVTFTSLLSACRHAGLVEEGLCLFLDMVRKFNITPRMQHYGCIVDLLGRAGRLEEAYQFITGMPVEPDGILWRSLLSACRVHGNVSLGEKVGRLLLQLQSQQTSTDLTVRCEDYISLSNVYASAEKWEDVEIVRRAMKVKGIEMKAGCSSVPFSNSLG